MRMLLKDLQPHTVYILQMRTVAGDRRSDWSRSFELHTLKDEVPPNPVTNLSGTMSEGNLSLFWEAPTHNTDGTPVQDLKDYRVLIGPEPEDPEWNVYEIFSESPRAEFPKELNVASFGRYRAALKISVQARDLVGNLSEPAIITIVKAPPNPPTNLLWESVGDAYTGTWDAPTANTDGSAFTDPDGYDVKVVYATTNVKTYSVPTPKFDYSYEQNKADFGGVFGTAKSPLTLEVRARDSVGQLSAPIIMEAGNPAPLKVTGVVASQVSEGVRVVWDGPTAADDDLVMYEVWSASTPTGAGTLYGRVSPSQREYIHQTVAYSQDHYLYVTAVDEFQSRSPESDRSGPVRPKSPFTVDQVAPAATTLTATTTAGRAQTDPAAVTLSWPKVADADLAGYHIRFSRAVDTTRSWEFHDVIDKTATSALIAGLASDTPYAFQIRSYDTMINTSSWSAEATARSSISKVPPMTEISSNISVITGGVLRSENYNEVNGTGWRLMHSGLDIQSGSVNARVIRAGVLMSTQNVTFDGTTQPAWSLNLAGNASLNDVQVRGKMVVGAGTGSGNVNIASANYGGAGSQWAIKGDGTIDLKSGGTGANSLQINSSGIQGYDAGGNQRIVLNTAGQFTLATTNGGVRFDDNGIYGYSGATNTFYINRNGAAYFSGQIAAGSGHVGNWNITTNNLYAGNLNMRADLGMIYGGDGVNRVAMRAGEGFWAGGDWSGSNPPFRVNINGYLYARSGQIGGFILNGDSGLYSGDHSSRVMMQPGWGFWAGANSRDSAPFRVTASGQLVASGATIYGNIYADGGEIRGTLRGGTIEAGQFITHYYGNRRLIMGPNISDSYYSGMPALRFDNGYGSYSGIAGDARNAYIFAAEYSSARIHLSADAGEGGQIAFITGSGTKMTITGNGVHLPSDRYLNMGQGLRQMINLYGTGYGIGIQNSTFYFRTQDGFCWYRHGGHSSTQNDPGGGARNMRLDYWGGLYVASAVYANNVQLNSARRFKTNVSNFGATEGLSKLKSLRPVSYMRQDRKWGEVPGLGFIAEEVNNVLPELVGFNEENQIETLDYIGIIPVAVKAVQELEQQVAELRAEVATLRRGA